MGVSAVELAFRQQLMGALTERASRSGGVITRRELDAFAVGDRTVRVIDSNRGIWNPSGFDVTLSIISDPDSEYDDEYVDGGLLKYRHQKGTIEGIKTKLRRAAGTGAPLILLRRIAQGLFMPVCPVYVVEDHPLERAVLVALDESTRFMADPSMQWTISAGMANAWRE